MVLADGFELETTCLVDNFGEEDVDVLVDFSLVLVDFLTIELPIEVLLLPPVGGVGLLLLVEFAVLVDLVVSNALEDLTLPVVFESACVIPFLSSFVFFSPLLFAFLSLASIFLWPSSFLPLLTFVAGAVFGLGFNFQKPGIDSSFAGIPKFQNGAIPS